MLSLLGSVAISLIVLGLSVALAIALEKSGAINSELLGRCVIYGPLLIFWVVGMSSGHTALSSFSCFEGYRSLPNGLLLDPYSNETTRLAVLIDCGTGLLGMVLFELIWGAWFFTIPLGVETAFGLN